MVKLRHFGGLTIEEAAQALGISTTTANRYWAYARAWLHLAMTGGEQPAAGGHEKKSESHPDWVE